MRKAIADFYLPKKTSRQLSASQWCQVLKNDLGENLDLIKK
ncbi:Hypothetical protein PMT_2440 [Prochlorococcus marinus str. MIT 9313]|uniref:Uncharacterized protein n=1 Tax=Prochlorococcus marinus (strain MIT 9313) TaxID=74547 RepID=B9ERR0_PROMM|nr:Hypothetical protein PMT_2440 [Prochlorococcus marinus str. MIT 9313]